VGRCPAAVAERCRAVGAAAEVRCQEEAAEEEEEEECNPLVGAVVGTAPPVPIEVARHRDLRPVGSRDLKGNTALGNVSVPRQLSA
jgi:hypothetical protein